MDLLALCGVWWSHPGVAPPTPGGFDLLGLCGVWLFGAPYEEGFCVSAVWEPGEDPDVTGRDDDGPFGPWSPGG